MHTTGTVFLHLSAETPAETPEAHLCFGRDEPTLKLQMNGDKCVFRSWTASKLWGVSTWVPSLFCIVFLQTTKTN